MNICVYGAASNEIDKKYIELGEKLGEEIAKRGHNLVFGAGGCGMMGAVARGVHRYGGKITGVVPTFFNVDGILFDHCDELIRTETMRDRKQTMEDLSDAFIMTPGGIGTFEEFFEILTLKQLGRHEKAIVNYNINDYFKPITAMIDKAIEGKFMTTASRELFYNTTDLDDIMNYIENYKPRHFNILETRKIEL